MKTEREIKTRRERDGTVTRSESNENMNKRLGTEKRRRDQEAKGREKKTPAEVHNLPESYLKYTIHGTSLAEITACSVMHRVNMSLEHRNYCTQHYNKCYFYLVIILRFAYTTAREGKRTQCFIKRTTRSLNGKAGQTTWGISRSDELAQATAICL